jgi:hypothetical protein
MRGSYCPVRDSASLGIVYDDNETPVVLSNTNGPFSFDSSSSNNNDNRNVNNVIRNGEKIVMIMELVMSC